MYSQFGEDDYLVKHFFENRRSGTYLEVGAMDGRKFSNTLLLSDRGWTGILIEANPSMAALLYKNRRNDRCFNYAVAKHRGTILFSASNHEACGAVDTVISPEMREKRHRKSEKITVACAPLKDIINASSQPSIDFWSLDVEGSELECLETFDWNIRVGLIMIEMLDAYAEKNRKCRKILSEQGFTKHEKDLPLSELWINSNHLLDAKNSGQHLR